MSVLLHEDELETSLALAEEWPFVTAWLIYWFETPFFFPPREGRPNQCFNQWTWINRRGYVNLESQKDPSSCLLLAQSATYKYWVGQLTSFKASALMYSAQIANPRMVRIELCEILVSLFCFLPLHRWLRHPCHTNCLSQPLQSSHWSRLLNPNKILRCKLSVPFIKFNISARLRAHAVKVSL